tara:strand:- start:983 stop:2032 length:1050 start_codon:yes stop_codon:yes gene_type:complete
MSLFGKKKAFNKDVFLECGEDGKRTETARQVATPEDLMAQGTKVNKAMGGPGNTPMPQPFITFNTAQNEKVISHANSHIIFGQDRPAGELSGEGGKGYLGADTIDLVCGLAAKASGEDGPCDGMIVNRNFASDAARIYISGLTKIDTNFGIARESGDVEDPGSAIGMKADHVRVFGQQGVKIVTGKTQGAKGLGFTGDRNSKGGLIGQAGFIDLIAGNNVEGRTLQLPKMAKEFITWLGIGFDPEITYLQPAVKGENLLYALIELAELLDSLSATVLTMNTVLMGQGGVIASHPLNAPIAGPVSAAVGALTIWGAAATWSQKAQGLAWQSNFCDPQASRYICSRNVRLT